MNYKRIIGIVILCVGLIGIGGSLYVKHMVGEKVGNVKRKTEMATNNTLSSRGGPLTKQVGKRVNKMTDAEAAKYYSMAQKILYAGIVLVIVGGLTTAFVKTRK